MTNMSIQPLWLTYFIEILLVLEFQLTKTYFGTFSYKAYFRPQISSNAHHVMDTYPYSFIHTLLMHTLDPPPFSLHAYLITSHFMCLRNKGTNWYK